MSTEMSLRPYHGKVVLCRSLQEYRDEYTRITKQPYPFDDCPGGGRYIKLDGSDGDLIWLVWGRTFPCVVHELTHVLLHTFCTIGHNPTEGDGEPFCYMLSALMDEAQAPNDQLTDTK
jgi:hypothetical protein